MMDGGSLDGYWMARNDLTVRHELKALSPSLSAVTQNEHGPPTGFLIVWGFRKIKIKIKKEPGRDLEADC